MSIIIKKDIKTLSKLKNGDLTYEKQFNGAKSPPQEVSVEQLIEILAKEDYTGVHELLEGDFYHPYADLDCSKDITKENFERRKYDLFKAGYDHMEEVFGGNVVMFCSSGQTKDGSYKVSAHFVVNDVKMASKEHIRFMLAKDMDRLSFDPAVYNKSHLMRLPYCKKPNDTRVLRLAELKPIDGGVVFYGTYHKGKLTPYTMDEFAIISGLITCCSDDDELLPAPECYVPRVKKVALIDDDEDDDDDDDDDEDEVKVNKPYKPWSSWTFGEAKDVIMRLNDNAADTHDKRIKGICSILHLAKILKKYKKFGELAHLFAKKDPNYSEYLTGVEYKDFRNKTHPDPVTFGSLVRQANIDNPIKALAEVEIKPTHFDEKHVLFATAPTLRDVQQWMIGCVRLCLKRGGEEWFHQCTDGWHRLKSNKENFPFATTTSNSKFGDTNFKSILIDLKDTQAFANKCLTDGARFWPYYNEPDQPNIINLFRGWAHTPSVKPELNLELKGAAKLFNEHVLMLFGEVPGKYVLNTLTRKLHFPRERAKFIIGYGKIGGEGKMYSNLLLLRYSVSSTVCRRKEPNPFLDKARLALIHSLKMLFWYLFKKQKLMVNLLYVTINLKVG